MTVNYAATPGQVVAEVSSVVELRAGTVRFVP